MFEKLLERHGGQLLQSASQAKYRTERKFSERFEGGLCSAMTTLWVTKRAQGRDFFKYLDSDRARGEVAQLQAREDFGTEALTGAIGQTKATLSKMTGGKIDLALGAEIIKQQKRLVHFVKESAAEGHKWRADYIEKQTGLEGVIAKHDKLGGASSTVKATEGYTILGVHGKKGGHAMGIYSSPTGGVRFYDPNFGEAYFEKAENFQRFLSDLTEDYIDYLGGESHYETTSMPSPVFPSAPEDFQKANGGGYLPLGMVVADAITGTAEETKPLLSDYD